MNHAEQIRPGGHQPADHVTVISARLADGPPGTVYALCRQSVAARLVRDPARAGADEVTDLGPGALRAARRAENTPGFPRSGFLIAGVTGPDGTWLAWNLAGSPEPVPASRAGRKGDA